jgi:polyisoprenoid-binding protein YceI
MKSKNKIIKNISILLLVLLNASISLAQVYTVENGNAFFKATMPLNSYTGNSNQLHGSIDFETGLLEFSVPVKSIETGITNRDDHMYELLNVDENPEVVFNGKIIEKFDPDLKTNLKLSVKGNFKLAGTTREVTIEIELSPEEKGLRLKASWILMITDYNIKRPSKVFLKVNDEHELGVNALLFEKIKE